MVGVVVVVGVVGADRVVEVIRVVEVVWVVEVVRVVEVIRVFRVVKVVCRCWENLEVKGPSPRRDVGLCLTMQRRAGKNA